MWRLKQWLKRIAAAWQRRREIRQEKRIKRQWERRARTLPVSPEGKVLLHIGCGEINAPDYINLDARPQPHVHLVTTNLFKLTMIPDNAIDLIYMSHVLEHVSHRSITETLQEMRRILKKDGVLRVSVPDFDHILNIYQSTGRDIAAIEQPLMGGQDYPFNFHYTVFNNTRLRKCMLSSGFREVREWNPNTCDHHDFDDWASKTIPWSGRDFPISLNIEAVK